MGEPQPGERINISAKAAHGASERKKPTLPRLSLFSSMIGFPHRGVETTRACVVATTAHDPSRQKCRKRSGYRFFTVFLAPTFALAFVLIFDFAFDFCDGLAGFSDFPFPSRALRIRSAERTCRSKAERSSNAQSHGGPGAYWKTACWIFRGSAINDEETVPESGP